MALHALDDERARLRAAAADLDAIAHHFLVGWLAQHAVVEEFFAARRGPSS